LGNVLKNKKVSFQKEYAVKATHLFLRELRFTPELRTARRIRKNMRRKIPKNETVQFESERILIATMRDWAAHVHFEALLGHLLKIQGAEVHHLTCGGGLSVCDRVNTWEGPPMPCRSCSKYVSSSLKAHGAQFSSLSKNWGENDWPELDTMSLEELSEIMYKGFNLGLLVDIPVKWFLLEETLADDPIAIATYRSFLRSARSIVDSVEKALEEFSPTQVLLLNGLLLFESIIWEVCRSRHIPVVTYERAFILDTFVFSREEAAGYYRFDEAWRELQHVELTPLENNELDNYLLDRQHGLRASDDYWRDISYGKINPKSAGKKAVLFTNLVWDAAVLRQDIAFPSIVDWIVKAISEFQKRPDDELIIRVHPAETKLLGRESREEMEAAIRAQFDVLPGNVTIIPSSDSQSSYQLMQEADFGLVYSSTAGLEMALSGKPVIVAAQTHYRGKGFTVDVASPSEFVAAIDQLTLDSHLMGPDLNLARRYAHLFFFKAAFSDMGVAEPIRGLVKLTSDDPVKMLERGGTDLKRFISGMKPGGKFIATDN
jgi:hypothetical protein